MHSAADTYHDEPGYLEMLGNEFLTHGEQAAVDALVENATHPAAAPLGIRFAVFDEIYKFTRPNRGEVTMLLSLDRIRPMDCPSGTQPADLPFAWAKATVGGASSTPRSAIVRMCGRTPCTSSTSSVASAGSWNFGRPRCAR